MKTLYASINGRLELLSADDFRRAVAAAIREGLISQGPIKPVGRSRIKPALPTRSRAEPEQIQQRLAEIERQMAALKPAKVTAAICMARQRAERAGQDTSQFPPRYRGTERSALYSKLYRERHHLLKKLGTKSQSTQKSL
jgi:hypothetical protein